MACEVQIPVMLTLRFDPRGPDGAALVSDWRRGEQRVDRLAVLHCGITDCLLQFTHAAPGLEFGAVLRPEELLDAVMLQLVPVVREMRGMTAVCSTCGRPVDSDPPTVRELLE